MRCYYSNEPLTTSLAAKMSVFCGRMEVVRLNNRKLDARLQILLYATYFIIGNTAAARVAYENYQRVADAVTNGWTKALIALIISILNRDISSFRAAYEQLQSLDATSKAQQMIVAEYDHYASVSGAVGR